MSEQDDQEFHLVFPADLRNTQHLNAIAQSIEEIINVALREKLSYYRGYPPPSINLRLAEEGRGEFIELTVSVRPFQLTPVNFEE